MRLSRLLIPPRVSRPECNSQRHSNAQANGNVMKRSSNTGPERDTDRQKCPHRLLSGIHRYPSVPASTGETERRRSTASGTTDNT